MRNEKIHVTGHRKPDSDSIISAIAYANLLKETGHDACACCLGDINDETKFLLNRFGYEEPTLLEDARVTLDEIDLQEPICLSGDTTIFKTLELMNNKKSRLVGVGNEENKLQGIVTRSDLSILGTGDTALGIDLMKETPIELMADTIEGKIIYKANNRHLNGKVSIIAMAETKLARYEISDRIVIIGNDPEAQKESIRKGAGLLIVVWADNIDDSVIEVAKEYNCSIIKSGIGCMNTSRYLYFSVPIKLVMQKSYTFFKANELVEDVMVKMRETTFNAYPVIDENDVLIGYVSRYHIMNAKNKKIVMVDHNEFAQSVTGIEKAELIEVIDHHRIHNFSTMGPIRFRNEIIGSTASIIASIYMERNIEISKNLAGLLLGAIISDTLNFQSPTTTQKDIEIAKVLSEISEENSDVLAYKMFAVTMNLPSDITEEELTRRMESDMKIFDMKGSKVLISQVFILELDTLKNHEDKIERILENQVLRHNCDLMIVAFTSVNKKGSIFYGKGTKENLLWETFGQKGEFVEDVLSRKKQIVPEITQTFNKYN